MNFITAKQAALLWGITPRRVQDMCRNGEIKGVVRHGREWLIPENAKKPKRTADVQDDLAVEAPKVFGGIIDFYKVPGTAADILISLAGDEFAYDIFSSQLCFYQGDFNTAISLALKHADENETNVSYRVSVGLQLMLGAIFVGDIKLWKRGHDYLKNTVCASEYEKHSLDFWLGVGSSAVSNRYTYPDWFKRGDFTKLPPNAFPAACYHYTKYLYTVGADQGNDSIEIVHTMPRIIEPLTARVCMDGALIFEIYLRLMCALAYHIAGNDTVAVPHLDRAIALALPDKLYTPLAEYRRRFGFLMDERIMLKSESALPEIKSVSKSLIEGWTALHNEVTGRSVSSKLSTREWQTARLASYGLSNKEIADRIGVTVNAVKQALRMAMDKTGAESRSEIGKYL